MKANEKLDEVKVWVESEPAISKWLASFKNPSTRINYTIVMQTFQEFTGLRGEDFLAEIDAEEAKPLTQRGSIEKRFVPFFEWFTSKGNAEGTAVAKIGAIMSFYRFYNYRCNFSPGKTFKAAKKNREVNITKEDVKKLCFSSQEPSRQSNHPSPLPERMRPKHSSKPQSQGCSAWLRVRRTSP